MILLESVLDADACARVREGLEAVAWAEGKRTAGASARPVKVNEQARPEDKAVAGLERFVTEALYRHGLFEIAARPKAITRVLFSRYLPGMTYGAHVDDALMGAGDTRLRTDLAFTLFLAPLDTYEGGALVIENAAGEQEMRLEAGSAVLYPATSIHRVAPVSRGARLGAVGWVQSFVRGAQEREILFDLAIARARMGAHAEGLRIDKAVSNLMRLWAEV